MIRMFGRAPRTRWLAAALAAVGGGAAAQQLGPAVPVASVAALEGPAATASGDVYFTDAKNNRIWKRAADGTLTVFRASANYANGLAVDDADRLYAAEGGDPAKGTEPRITRTDLTTGKVTVLARSFGNRMFQSPNDITVDGQGRVWFTDWVRPDFLPALAKGRRNVFGVYRIDRDGTVHRVLGVPQVEAPNGIILSLDDRTLYLVETNRAAGGRRRIDAYAVAPDGSLSQGRVFHDFGPGRSGDGMAIDSAGRLWVAAGLNQPRPGGETLATRAGVYVFAPDGKLLAMVPIGEDLLTNVAFGGPDRRYAFVTAGKTLFKIESDRPGTRR